MSLQDLCDMHAVKRYPITETADDMLGVVESIGTKEADLRARMTPLTVEERNEFDQNAENELYWARFSSDPSLDHTKCLVWNSKVWRVRETRDCGQLGRYYKVLVEHAPEVELSTP